MEKETRNEMTLEISKQCTVGMIQSTALEQRATIMQRVKKAQLKVVVEKQITTSDTPFPDWITSTPACVFVVEGINAVQRWLDTVGPEDVNTARETAPTSLRALYGADACYASKSSEDAERDVAWLQQQIPSTPSTPSSLSSASSASQGGRPRIPKSAPAPKTKTATARKEAATSEKTGATAARPRSTKPGVQGIRTATPTKPAGAQIKKTTVQKNEPATSRPSATGRSLASKTSVVDKKTGTPRSAVPRTRKTSMSMNSVNKSSASGGVSKNTPPISVLTGRTRKYSRTDKKPEVNESRKAPARAAASEPPKLKTDANVAQNLVMTSTSSSEKEETESDHDAEVAATVLASQAGRRDSTPSLGRDSFSPGSVVSLPRPETPEVDQLRHRFETLSHNPVMEKHQSTLSPEIMLRIKELKPKGPVGTRVKSMVEFFMDESRHQWEF